MLHISSFSSMLEINTILFNQISQPILRLKLIQRKLFWILNFATANSKMIESARKNLPKQFKCQKNCPKRLNYQLFVPNRLRIFPNLNFFLLPQILFHQKLFESWCIPTSKTWLASNYFNIQLIQKGWTTSGWYNMYVQIRPPLMN